MINEIYILDVPLRCVIIWGVESGQSCVAQFLLGHRTSEKDVDQALFLLCLNILVTHQPKGPI